MTIIHSSTKTRPRPKHDVYETPYEVAYSALQYIKPSLKYNEVLDIGAGNGVWGTAFVDRFGDNEITGVDIRDVSMPPAYKYWHRNFDLFAMYQSEIQKKFDIVIGNPPYNLAEECVRFALSRKPNEVLMLLKLSFLESIKRGHGLFEEFPPYAVYVSMRRISFFKTKKSSTGDYATALFHWKRDDRSRIDPYTYENYTWACGTQIKWWDYKEKD